jgi:hypothetical protein
MRLATIGEAALTCLPAVPELCERFSVHASPLQTQQILGQSEPIPCPGPGDQTTLRQTVEREPGSDALARQGVDHPRKHSCKVLISKQTTHAITQPQVDVSTGRNGLRDPRVSSGIVWDGRGCKDIAASREILA